MLFFRFNHVIVRIALLLAFISVADRTVSAEVYPLEVEKLKKFSPRASSKIIDALVKEWSDVEKCGIISEIRFLHFISQISTETGGFRRIDENMNYSAARLREVFPNRVSEAQANRLANRPMDIANYVYANRLGNGDVDSGDGWNFRGSGYIQLTGRENFRLRGAEIGDSTLEKFPDTVRDPELGFKVAVAYWNSARVNRFADRNSIREVRKAINGGTNGLEHAKLWYARAKRIFGESVITSAASEEETSEEEFEALSYALVAQGFISDADLVQNSVDVSEALKRYQIAKDLPVTGELDLDTLYLITDPDNHFSE